MKAGISHNLNNISSWHQARLLNCRRPTDPQADSWVGKRSRKRTNASIGGLSVFGRAFLPEVEKEQGTKADIASQAEDAVEFCRMTPGFEFRTSIPLTSSRRPNYDATGGGDW